MRVDDGVVLAGSLQGRLVAVERDGRASELVLSAPVLDACALTPTSAADECLLAVSTPECVQVLGMHSHKPLATLRVAEGQPTRVAAVPELGSIAYGDEAGGLYLWNASAKRSVRLRRHRKSLHQLLALTTARGTLLASASDDRVIYVTDPRTEEVIATCHPHVDWLESLTATVSRAGSVSLLAIDRRRAVTWVLDAEGRLVHQDAFDVEKVSARTAWRTASDQASYAVGTEAGDLVVWDAKGGHLSRRLDGVASAIASANERIIVALHDGRVLSLSQEMDAAEDRWQTNPGRGPLLELASTASGVIALGTDGHIWNLGGLT